MATPSGDSVSPEQFRMMADIAGLGMTSEELDELKPLYDLYYQYVKALHSIDLGAEEINLAFHPDWPSA